ncbi:MAG: serine racemase VanT catalytic subunit, partial [Lachnospiraceae bacterium]|nr:serine racemase VanT catalytic subunit [Lachnospiraceae bacterium]
MCKSKSYTGIDCFRFMAALLIIAIHTSPLASFNEMADFILTRVVARVAVPFFLMTSGFFLISRYTRNADRLIAFIKNTALIYGAAILIYIPVNIYNGYFRMDNLVPNIIKDIVFDGTMYHLWYLPASAIGAVIAWYLVKKAGYKKALMVSVILYLIGMFGDSWYGIAEKVSVLKSFYGFVFQITDYTRNGIFFVPVFMILGGLIADNNYKFSFKKSILGFFMSFAFMFVEAMMLHHYKLQRHDSMYIFLLPCMFFLFNAVLHFRGKRYVWLRTSSLIIYIIHPMIIVAIRLFSKIMHLQELLVENSIVHYIMVCLLSVIFGISVTILWNKYKPGKPKHISGTDRTYLEINLDNLEHNVKVLRKAMMQNCELMAVVKTEAYGHGAFEISTHLNKMGVRAFAVATIDEGIKLRKYGIDGDILILGYTNIQRASELKKYDLTQTLGDYDYAKALNNQGIIVKVHIKIDTGMHRLGISADDFVKVKRVFSMRNIKVCGIFTHLCCSDSLEEDDVLFTRRQIDRFYGLIDVLEGSGITIPKLHIQSSYGLLNYPYLKCDYIRVGIALYGVLSSPNHKTKLELDLRPVLSLKSKVVLIRSVKEGDSVGYGRNFIAEHDSRIAILPVGYGDGYPRSLSMENSSIIINRKRVPVIGRICMDSLVVDITDAGEVSVGDTAILIGMDECGGLPAPDVAESYGSISNELLCRMGARMPV